MRKRISTSVMFWIVGFLTVIATIFTKGGWSFFLGVMSLAAVVLAFYVLPSQRLHPRNTIERNKSIAEELLTSVFSVPTNDARWVQDCQLFKLAEGSICWAPFDAGICYEHGAKLGLRPADWACGAYSKANSTLVYRSSQGEFFVLICGGRPYAARKTLPAKTAIIVAGFDYSGTSDN